jgi:hypothetical protein
MHAALLLYYDWQSEIDANPRLLNDKTDEDLDNIAMEVFMSNSNVSYLYEQHNFEISKVTNLFVALIKFGNFQCLPVATLIANMSAF